jgi:hypothetical protein
LSELDTHLEVAKRLGFFRDTADAQDKIDRVSALVLALAKSLKAKES